MSGFLYTPRAQKRARNLLCIMGSMMFILAISLTPTLLPDDNSDENSDYSLKMNRMFALFILYAFGTICCLSAPLVYESNEETTTNETDATPQPGV